MTLTTLLLSEVNQQVTYRAKGAGEVVVLIHGVGMQSAAWGPQIERLSREYHVIALDMPGHGESDLLPQGGDLSDYVDWCRAVIDALGLGPVNIAGHSMGALIAGGVATAYPSLVKRVALLNGVFRRDQVAKTAVQARAAEIRDGKIDIETPLARWFDEHQQEERAQVAAWLSEVDPDGYATAYSAFADGDGVYADRYSDITCPFLAMTGDGDPNSTPAMTHLMADAARNGCGIIIENHRHMINLTAAEEVNTHLCAWLKEPDEAKEMQ